MSKLRLIFASGVLIAPLFAGCADTTSAAQLADLQKRLDAEMRRTAASEHKIDELENRVFLLTDQVESQKVAAIRRSKQPLPIVTLKPDAPTPNDSSGDVLSDGSEEIVFEGAAKSSDPSHTVIRIDGTRVVSHREAKSEPRSEPRFSDSDTSVHDEENLGVAPVPSIH
ncbi:MAG TPA: hypothetical protein VGH63_18340, partial [Polyangia bacterium]